MGTFDVEKLSLEHQKEMAFLQKRWIEKLKMRKNIRCCILWAGFCDVEMDHLKTRLSSGQ